MTTWRDQLARVDARLRAASFVLTGCLVVLAACGGGAATTNPSGSSSNGAGSTDAIKLGGLVPLSGEGGPFGVGMSAAMQIAVDEVNEAGGPLGQQLEITFEDDGTDPDQAVRGAEKLINVDDVSAILGTWASSSTLAVAPLTIEANIIEMNTSGSPDITTLDDNGTVFRMGGSDAIQGAVMARAMYEQGLRNITILSSQQSGNIGQAESFEAEFERVGGTILETIVYVDTQPSYRTEVNQALATEPEMIFLAAYEPEATIILREAFEAGAENRWLATIFAVTQNVIDALGPEAVEEVTVYDVAADRESPAYTRLADAYTEDEGIALEENVYAALAYDSVQLLALAIEQAGTTETEAVSQALIEVSGPGGTEVSSFAEGAEALSAGEDIDYRGATGAIDFDDAGDQQPVEGVWEIDNGEFVFQGTFE